MSVACSFWVGVGVVRESGHVLSHMANLAESVVHGPAAVVEELRYDHP